MYSPRNFFSFSLLDFMTYLIFIKLTFSPLSRRGDCFHKKMGKSPFFMLTKVILLKALFEEEIRRTLELEGYRVSHIYLYGWVLRVVDYLSFLLALSTSEMRRKSLAQNLTRAHKKNHSRKLIGYFLHSLAGIYN